MNKLDFLRRLDRELRALDQTERRELLAFYEERFYTGTIYENKTEAEVIAELESPETIARNILSEYGISQKDVQRQTNRQPKLSRNEVDAKVRKVAEPQGHQVNSSSLIALIVIDVLVLSWALPSLFSVVASLGGSLLSYFGVLSLLVTGNIYDLYIFWFLTGAYVLLFLFTLVVLEFFIWAVKKTILWHMKVLRYKKVNEYNKKFSKISVEGWFKRHKFLRFIKNISGIAAIFVMVFTGLFLYSNYDEINELYIELEETTVTETIDVSADITNEELWTIIAEIDSMDVEVIPSLGSEIIVTRSYFESREATYSVTFNKDTNELVVIHDLPMNNFNWGLSIENFFALIRRDELVIEVPAELLLAEIDLQVSDGQVDIFNLDVAGDITVDGSNGEIDVSTVTVGGDLYLESSNARMNVKDVVVENKITVMTSNGRIYVRDTSAVVYQLETSNGGIDLLKLNVDNNDGVVLDAHSSNGTLDFEDVYVAEVNASTSNGNIVYYNDDLSFDVDFDGRTSNGSTSTNVN